MSICGEKRKNSIAITDCRHTAPAILIVAGVATQRSLTPATQCAIDNSRSLLGHFLNAPINLH